MSDYTLIIRNGSGPLITAYKTVIAPPNSVFTTADADQAAAAWALDTLNSIEGRGLLEKARETGMTIQAQLTGSDGRSIENYV